MGVHGLWKLIEPSGHMVPLETLAGKVLAVDVSIWLHQAIKGMHDTQGAPVAVAHLLILFHRLCKLLFYKIKPVFVFDGGVPALKKQTIAARKQQSSSSKNEAMKIREKLIKNLLKHEAVRQVLSNETASAALGLNSFTLPGPSVEEDLYKLPPIAAADHDDSASEEVTTDGEEEEEEKRFEDIHSIDVTSKEFLSLPAEVRHDILTEMIETRKQNSWKLLHTMPKQSDSFSDFQMNRLLKRWTVQTSLEKAGKEMGGKALSLKELESLLGEQGVLDPKTDLPGRRIAQDSVTRYMLIQNNSNDSGSEFTAQKKEIDKSEKFDIMNHLEDVEYSSESDTDIILNKPRGKREEVVQKTEPSEEKKVDSVKIKSESKLLSRQPKVRMTEEIANILSILEDDDVSSDIKVKVEDLQRRIHFNNPDTTKTDIMEKLETIKVEIMSDDDSDTKQPNLIPIGGSPLPIKEEPKPPEITPEEVYSPVAEVPEKEPEDVVEKVEVPLPVHEKVVEELSEKESEEVPRKVPADVPNTERKFIENGEAETEKDKIEVGSPTVAEVPEFSSDSESEFVPIGEDNTLRLEETVKPKATGESFTVTINTSKFGDSEDIFADVFKSRREAQIERIPEEEIVEEMEADDEENQDRVSEPVLNDEVTQFGKKVVTTSNLNDLKKDLENEQYDLMMEQGKQERHALNLTDQIYTDAQELLRLFGIPFVVAPMEAEAQCATLNIIGLTEGTITDDSDIWLFGGRVVYKNFFNQNKHVLEYRSEDIQKYFKLTREDMIKMAMLVGSDYTVGLNGIGPVTALEILAAFHSPSQEGLLDDLQKFRDWFTGRTKTGPHRATLKKKIRNTIIGPGFPNRAVAEAYLHPQVDDSKEPFSWAKPKLDLIRKYTKTKLGWSSEKCNEFLSPVMKKLEENTSQHTMEKYFRMVQKTSLAEGMLSKRVETAIRKLGKGSVDEDGEEMIEPIAKPKKKRKRRQSKEAEDGDGEGEDSEEALKTKKKPVRAKQKIVPAVSSRSAELSEDVKTKLINARLHSQVKVPQKEATQKLLDDRKRQAIEIFRTFKKGKKKKTKVYAKEEVKLSESSSDGD